MKWGEKTVQIVEHRFDNSIPDKKLLESCGRYCVQFNTFKNTSDSLELLRWWEAQCVSSCDAAVNGTVFGDQKYLDNRGLTLLATAFEDSLGCESVTPYDNQFIIM